MPTPQETFEAYIAVWNVTEDAEFARLLAICWAEDAVYCDPNSRVTGHQGLKEVINSFHDNFGGLKIVPQSGLDLHHDKLRFTWAMTTPDGKTVGGGMDFGELAQDGRLKSITGFFGPFPALP